MSQTTMEVEINKSRQGYWGYITIVKHPEWANEAVTSGHRYTLKSVLWHSTLDCVDINAKLLSVIVNGASLPFDKVWEIVYNALVNTALEYRLSDIEKLLEV